MSRLPSARGGCVDCGAKFFQVVLQARGQWVRTVHMSGEVEHTCLDGVRLQDPRTVACEECGRRHANDLPSDG